MRLIACLALGLVCGDALADDPAYLDDRSSPERLIASFYNALERQEPARAYAYFVPGAAPADFEAWADPLRDITGSTLTLGEPHTDARAAEIFYAVPVRVQLVDWQGAPHDEVGCIGVVFQLPHDAVPPWQPMSITFMDMIAEPAGAASTLPRCDD